MTITLTEVLAGLCSVDTDDAVLQVEANSKVERVRAITWDLVKQETGDLHLLELLTMIQTVFPEER